MKLKSGDRFGMLTIVKWNRQRKAWLCGCDCGGETYARAWALKTGRHRRCSCGQTISRPHRRLPDNLGAKREIMRLYQKAAKKRGYSFELNEEKFIQLLEQPCWYCKTKPSMVLNYYNHAKDRGFRHSGVDRVNNNIGYTVDNSVPCCKICNNAKSTLSLEEWKTWIKQVYNQLFAN